MNLIRIRGKWIRPDMVVAIRDRSNGPDEPHSVVYMVGNAEIVVDEYADMVADRINAAMHERAEQQVKALGPSYARTLVAIT